MTKLWIRHAAESAAIARRVIWDSMRGSGADAAQADDGALIVSELVSNAVRHAPALPSGHLMLEWARLDGGLQIAVTDGGRVAHLDPPTDVRSNDTGGRGLRIVAVLSKSWGVHTNTGRTVVWAVAPITLGTDPGPELPGAPPGPG